MFSQCPIPDDGRSILDDLREQADSLSKSLGRDDRGKLDEYLTSIRELEKQMVSDRDWARKLTCALCLAVFGLSED